MSIKLTSIKEVGNQDIVYGIFYCKYKELKKTKYGDSYINVGLSDNSGVLDSKVWKNSKFYYAKFNEGDVVAVKGAPNLYRNKMELNITHIVKCDSLKYKRYGFDSAMIVPRIDLDSQTLWKDINKYFKKTGNREALVKKMYSDYKQSVFLFPSSIEPEFQVEGTYLRDTLKALNILDVLMGGAYSENVADYELMYGLICLSRFHLVTGYEKDNLYKIRTEALDRGAMTVFYDIFKRYKKLTDSQSFFSLEKCLFDSSCKDYGFERKMVDEIFLLVEHAS